MKKTLSLFSVTLVALSLSSCMYNKHKDLPPGQYERSSASVDSNGTARSTKSSTNIYYDKYGHRKSDVNTKTSTDPKGLFNKTTTTTTRSTEK
jgi:hypothetical protein